MPRTELRNRVEYRNSAGDLHRDGDLPAKEMNNGTRSWWIEGKRHRIDNPALIWIGGTVMLYLNGASYSELSYYRNLYPYKGILLDTSTECQRGRDDYA